MKKYTIRRINPLTSLPRIRINIDSLHKTSTTNDYKNNVSINSNSKTNFQNSLLKKVRSKNEDSDFKTSNKNLDQNQRSIKQGKIKDIILTLSTLSRLFFLLVLNCEILEALEDSSEI